MKIQPARASRRRLVAAIAGAGLTFAGAGLAVAGGSVLSAASATVHHHHSRPAPILTLTHSNPISVSGRHFRPRTRVHVVLAASQTSARDPKATRAGTFTVSFPGVVIDRCSSWSVTASQRHGAQVVLRTPAKPECAPL